MDLKEALARMNGSGSDKAPSFPLALRRKQAIKLAEKLEIKLHEYKGVNLHNIDEVALRIAPITKCTEAENMRLLKNMVPVRNDFLGRYRIALAILAYQKDQRPPDGWSGEPPIYMYINILEASVKVSESGKRTLRLLAMPMSNHMAGQLLIYNLKFSKGYALLRQLHVSSLKRQADMSELTGCWARILLGRTKYETMIILRFDANSAVAKHNADLWHSRRGGHCRTYNVPCHKCKLGRDQCPNACRMVSRKD